MPKAAVQKRESLSQVAYNQIRAMILQRELAPGEFVSECHLQEVLGLGRTPVREALLALAQNGLVTVHPRKGVEVTHPTPKAVHDIFEFRSLVEPLILRRCFPMIDRKWAQDLREQLQRRQDCRNSDAKREEADLIDLDSRFHLELAGTLRNQYIDQMLRSMLDYLSLIRFTVWDSEQYLDSNHTHIAILDAILADDVEEACRLLTKHLHGSYQEAIDAMMHMAF